MKSTMAITQRDLAKEAGVSLATVSLALSGGGRISPATRERIRSLAAKMNYAPAPDLSALIRRRWEGNKTFARIAVAISDNPTQRTCALSFLETEHPFHKSSRIGGFCLEPLELARKSAGTIRQRLRFLNADAVLVPMLPDLPVDIESVLTERPCLALGCLSLNIRMPLVEPDVFFHSFLTTEKMISTGAKRLGLVLLDAPHSRGQCARLGGFLAARDKSPSQDHLPVIFWKNGDEMQIKNFVSKYNPDGLVLHDSRWFPQLQKAAPQIGREIPLAATITFPESPVAGVCWNGTRLAWRAVTVLSSMLRTGQSGAQLGFLCESVRFDWRAGGTM